MTLHNQNTLINKDLAESIDLNRYFYWFEEKLTPLIAQACGNFFSKDIKCHLFVIDTKFGQFFKGQDYFATQLQLSPDVNAYYRFSTKSIKIFLDSALGHRSISKFKLKELTELEVKLINSFSEFLFKRLEKTIIPKHGFPDENSDQFLHLDFLVYQQENNLETGNIIISLPVSFLDSISPLKTPEKQIELDFFNHCLAEIDVLIGKTKLNLEDLKNLEKEDIVILDKSNLHLMKIVGEYNFPLSLTPDPRLIINIDNNGGQNTVSEEASINKNMWDNIQVDVKAEFKKIKLPLGELRQISEGLVVSVAPIAHNEVFLTLDNKQIAAGELVIVGDKYGVKLSKILYDIESNTDNDSGIIETETIQGSTNDEKVSTIAEDDIDYEDFEIEDDI